MHENFKDRKSLSVLFPSSKSLLWLFWFLEGKKNPQTLNNIGGMCVSPGTTKQTKRFHIMLICMACKYFWSSLLIRFPITE